MRMIRLTGEAIAKDLAEGAERRPMLGPSALTLGAFDGLHLGHRRLFQLVSEARDRLDLETAVVFTFVQNPRQVLRPSDEPFQLTAWRAKLALLQAAGCETLVAADFSPALSRLGYRDFVETILMGQFGMRHFVAGYDVHLGADRGGTAAALGELGRELDFGLEICPPVEIDGETISSSAIRTAIRAGNLERANRMLGRPYGMWGVVGSGESRGHTLGYPTANIQALEPTKLMPATGVYAVRVAVPGDVAPPGTAGVLDRFTAALPEVDLEGNMVGAAPADWAAFGGMLNCGYVPTFHGQGLPAPRAEANLFEFAGELQGRTVKVEWLARLRSEQRFEGRDQLVAQLARDARAARAVLTP